jgi:hypothetical protein
MENRVSQDPLHLSTSSDPSPDEADQPTASGLSRRGFLRGAAIAGGGIVAATIAACAPAAAPTWTYGPSVTKAPGAASAAPASAAATAAASAAASAPPASAVPSAAASAAAEAIQPGWTIHDVDARRRVRRYVGNLAPAFKDIYGPVVFAKLVEILGAADGYPELTQKPAFMQVGTQLVLQDILDPLKPKMEGDVKVFDLTLDTMFQKIDEVLPPVAAIGYNKQWPGPTIRVTQGDKIKVNFTNNLTETSGVHFHGVDFDDFFQDGIPFVTQLPITPGETYAYEFVANTSGSLMYHSHHNATDQVGRGMLGPFIVDPKTDPYGADREYTWISNDELGGFTINGHGFPATVPVLAAIGETVRIRFMNEGIMMHPWHSHGYRMKVIERDGVPLGSAAFECDTLGVNPGERWDVLIKADRPGIWAFHCHILPHVEGQNGMFGMVNTMIVVPKASDIDTIVAALLA